jgi:hypothetical protein
MRGRSFQRPATGRAVWRDRIALNYFDEEAEARGGSLAISLAVCQFLTDSIADCKPQLHEPLRLAPAKIQDRWTPNLDQAGRKGILMR